MAYFILKFDEINVPSGDDAMLHQILITATDYKTAKKVSELVKIIKEELDTNSDELKLDSVPDEEAEGYTPDEALEKNLISAVTCGFLNNFFIDNEEYDDWGSIGWHERIDIILEYLSTNPLVKSEYKLDFAIASVECVEIEIN